MLSSDLTEVDFTKKACCTKKLPALRSSGDETRIKDWHPEYVRGAGFTGALPISGAGRSRPPDFGSGVCQQEPMQKDHFSAEIRQMENIHAKAHLDSRVHRKLHSFCGDFMRLQPLLNWLEQKETYRLGAADLLSHQHGAVIACRSRGTKTRGV